MNDREQLEFAAKAAWMTGWRYAGALGMCKMIDPKRPDTTGSVGPNWNPITDDGDALRLAVKLRMTIMHHIDEPFGEVADGSGVTASTHNGGVLGDASYDEASGDEAAATRRAIVRAAAEIGRQMQEGGAA